jgi:hypothetical protein
VTESEVSAAELKVGPQLPRHPQPTGTPMSVKAVQQLQLRVFAARNGHSRISNGIGGPPPLSRVLVPHRTAHHDRVLPN